MSLQKAFDKLGYPIVLNEGNPDRIPSTGYRINTGKNEDGKEAFIIDLATNIELIPLDTKKDEAAMLIMFRDKEAPHGKQNLAKMLVGHDERQLFIAAVPRESKDVLDAKDKLKPAMVRGAEKRIGVKSKDKNKHRTKAWIRQGDFFFVPVNVDLTLDEKMVKKNQPLRRGAGNAHMLQEVIEVGGQSGWERRGAFITEATYQTLEEDVKRQYRRTFRNPTLYARGSVRHPEHKTVHLKGWHRVVPNTESRARTLSGRPVLGTMAYTD